MQNTRKYLVLALACLVLVSCKPRNETGLGPGDQAPGFTLPAIGQSKQISLSDYRGKTVLLNFWASWCRPCIEEVPALEKLYQQLAPQGFVVLGVGIDDDLQSLEGLKNRFGITFPVVLDNTVATKNAYKIQGVPESFIINPEGKLVLHSDVEAGDMTVRIIGPRRWDSAPVVGMFRSLIGQPSAGK